jgi:hypothetical protein
VFVKTYPRKPHRPYNSRYAIPSLLASIPPYVFVLKIISHTALARERVYLKYDKL